MAEKKIVKKTVSALVEELKENPSKRFSKSDFQLLIYAILSDETFKAKKHLLKNAQILDEEYSISEGMGKFLDKLLKHAGMSDAAERARIIETFEYAPKDVEFIGDAVDEAMYQYTECGKNMRQFRDKMFQLTISKIEKTGVNAGKIGYKKSVMDRAAAAAKASKVK